MRIALLIAVGLAMGIYTIFTGAGGGAVYVSVLALFFGIPAAVATSTSLAIMFPVAAVAAYLHAKDHNVNFRVGWVMVGVGAVGAVIGSACSGFIPQQYYNKVLGCVILAMSAVMFISKHRPHAMTVVEPGDARGVGSDGEGGDGVNSGVVKSGGEVSGESSKIEAGQDGQTGRTARTDCAGQSRQPTQRSKAIRAVSFGLLGGLISGVAGTSGTTSIIAGLMLLGVSTMHTVGTSVFVMSGLSLVGFLTRLTVGGIDWKLTGILVVSSILGALIGSVLLRRVETRKTPSASKNSSTIDWILILGNLAMGIGLLVK
ncbi:MAG: sulfite exporter TauE/SafE family protein [Bifidobacterium tibiigranuli]|jgi:uncharacterized membrane protein YfcA|nr:sulfite exporter TauE/SafE family protein [Bifidobacterium tibiigranuli]